MLCIGANKVVSLGLMQATNTRRDMDKPACERNGNV